MTFDDLVSAGFDRPLSAEERAELNRKIVEDPGCAERFATLARLHADLRNLHVIKGAAHATRRRRLPFQNRAGALPWGWAAAAAAIVIAMALYRIGSAPDKLPVPPSAAAPRPKPFDPAQGKPEPSPVVLPDLKEAPKEPEPVPPPADAPPLPRQNPKPDVPPLPLEPEPRKPEPVAPPPPPPAPAPPPATVVAVAHLGSLSGKVLRLGAEGSVRGKEGMELLEGHGLEVPAGAAATIVFPDKTRLEVEANTRIDSLQARESKRLVVKNGSLAAEVSAQPGGKPLVFVTPQAEAEILGTTLRIVADPRSTRLEVTEGKVRFTRLQDRKSIDVAGGFYAVAGPGIELKALPLPKVVTLLSLPFDDGKTPPGWAGKVGPGPVRTANRGSLEGQYFPNERLTRVKLAEAKGLFTFRTGSDLNFEYWVDGETVVLSVYLWNRTQALSMGHYEISPLTKKQWTRVTVALADLRDGDKRLQDGDIVADLTIQTNQGNGVLFVDNVEITAPRRK
jgi:ferric-dicitrate binding protein FerR (iron transport regulator)